jgi:hypothetical protein
MCMGIKYRNIIIIIYIVKMTKIINLYDGVLTYNDNKIIIVVDDNDMIWFYGKNKLLNY